MATKIKTLGITSLTIAAHAKFHGEVLELITIATPEALHLDVLAPAYQDAATAENGVVNRPSAYAETRQMQTADHARDQAVSLLFNLTDAYLRSPKASHADTAEKIAVTVGPYRNIQSHEMNRETQEVSGLIDALADKSMTEPLKSLGMDFIVEMLDELNADFTSAVAARDAEALSRQPVKEADSRQLRSACDDFYHQVVDTVNAYALIQPTKEITAFAEKMNVLTEKYKLVIANQGKKKNEKPEMPEEGEA